MRVRLGFSVAAHLDPDLLFVDEVLAVGDVEFQRRCLGKMGEASKEGRTVVFVSHNLNAVISLCSRGVVLEEGRVLVDTDARSAVAEYLRRTQDARRGDGAYAGRAYGKPIRRAWCADSTKQALSQFVTGDKVMFFIEYELEERVSPLGFAIVVYDAARTPIAGFHSNIVGGLPASPPMRGIVACTINRLPLNTGTYSVDLSVDSRGSLLDFVEGAFTFDVLAGDFFGTGKQPEPRWGATVVPHQWSLDETPISGSAATGM
jgi:lipopolysaccharide transport system ATP-binding protein